MGRSLRSYPEKPCGSQSGSQGNLQMGSPRADWTFTRGSQVAAGLPLESDVSEDLALQVADGLTDLSTTHDFLPNSWDDPSRQATSGRRWLPHRFLRSTAPAAARGSMGLSRRDEQLVGSSIRGTAKMAIGMSALSTSAFCGRFLSCLGLGRHGSGRRAVVVGSHLSCASSGTRTWALGVPQPVTGSQPLEAW